mmetsp:Transcript_15165/g.53229  ORF Transcript_15165/g.53229 Transcript_15165/m.53229 type:complete len:252 (-) Transcript_15165:3186-3941(-)
MSLKFRLQINSFHCETLFLIVWLRDSAASTVCVSTISCIVTSKSGMQANNAFLTTSGWFFCLLLAMSFNTPPVCCVAAMMSLRTFAMFWRNPELTSTTVLRNFSTFWQAASTPSSRIRSKSMYGMALSSSVSVILMSSTLSSTRALTIFSRSPFSSACALTSHCCLASFFLFFSSSRRCFRRANSAPKTRSPSLLMCSAASFLSCLNLCLPRRRVFCHCSSRSRFRCLQILSSRITNWPLTKDMPNTIMVT